MSFECDVCAKKDATFVHHGHVMHEGCAPGYWLKDSQTHSEFMGRVRVLGKSRYERWKAWKT